LPPGDELKVKWPEDVVFWKQHRVVLSCPSSG